MKLIFIFVTYPQFPGQSSGPGCVKDAGRERRNVDSRVALAGKVQVEVCVLRVQTHEGLDGQEEVIHCLWVSEAFD